jgi:hypothetical protein
MVLIAKPDFLFGAGISVLKDTSALKGYFYAMLHNVGMCCSEIVLRHMGKGFNTDMIIVFVSLVNLPCFTAISLVAEPENRTSM